MRDIKFKISAKVRENCELYSKKQKEFVNSKIHEVESLSFHGDSAVIPYEDSIITLFKSDCNFTLLEYTGLKDENGVEIYEGDIIRYFGEIYTVKFEEERCGFVPFASGDGCGCCEIYTISTDSKDIKVIGNIYDNPELLEADDK